MKKSHLIIYFYFIFNFSQGQITFEKATQNDRGTQVIQLPDSGYIVSGFHGNGDGIILYKTDVTGNVLWKKDYNGANADLSFDLIQTADGGYILAGTTESFGAGNSDACLIKVDSTGNLNWAKTFGGAISDQIFSIDKTLDEGYILAGNTFSFGAGYENVLLIKTDNSGDTLWTKTFGYGGLLEEYANSVITTVDSGFILAGTTFNFGAGNSDVYLIKTDKNGDTLWTRAYGGPSIDEGVSISQTTDGNYVILGFTDSFGAGGYDVYVIKTDSMGNILWSKAYGGSNYDFGYSIKNTSDGGFILTGETQSFPTGNYQYYLIKINSTGDIIWTRSFGLNDIERGESVQETMDGGYIVSGIGLLLKTDSIGNSDCYEYNTINNMALCNTLMNNTATIITSTNIVVTSPTFIVSNSNNQLPDACSVGISGFGSSMNFSIYPNPATDNLTITFSEQLSNCKISIYNLVGEECYSLCTFAKDKVINVCHDLAKGIYFVKANDGKMMIVKKLVIE